MCGRKLADPVNIETFAALRFDRGPGHDPCLPPDRCRGGDPDAVFAGTNASRLLKPISLGIARRVDYTGEWGADQHSAPISITNVPEFGEAITCPKNSTSLHTGEAVCSSAPLVRHNRNILYHKYYILYIYSTNAAFSITVVSQSRSQ